jgi:hypothetical protein
MVFYSALAYYHHWVQNYTADYYDGSGYEGQQTLSKGWQGSVTPVFIWSYTPKP